MYSFSKYGQQWQNTFFYAFLLTVRGPFYKHELNLIPPWINNHLSCKVWDEITYLFQNFNGAIIEVALHFMEDTSHKISMLLMIWWCRKPAHQQQWYWPSFRGHDDVIKWKYFPRYWPFVRGIHRSPVNSLHKGQWRGALMFSLTCVWINGWVNNREAGDLRRYRAHYDVIVMNIWASATTGLINAPLGYIDNISWVLGINSYFVFINWRTLQDIICDVWVLGNNTILMA